LLALTNLFPEDSQHIASFAKADVNGDGKISLDELKAITQTNNQIHRGMQAFDSSWTANSTASIIMTAADTNKDGSLSQAEYMSAVAKSQSGTNDLIDAQAANMQRRALGQPEKRE
jgi:Ca2+-binding EF-hand superfamily protein